MLIRALGAVVNVLQGHLTQSDDDHVRHVGCENGRTESTQSLCQSLISINSVFSFCWKMISGGTVPIDG